MMCKVSSPTVKVDMDNFVLPNFPPGDDFPVCMDPDGNVISTFGQDQWDMTYWCGKIQTFNFLIDTNARNSESFYRNAQYCMRILIVFFMWGAPQPIRPNTLVSLYHILRKIFSFCVLRSVPVGEFYRYPLLVQEFISEVGANGSTVVTLLRTVFEHQDTIGFKILSPKQILDLHTHVRAYKKGQTAYIPPRISSYHLTRSIAMLDQFHANKQQFMDLFEYALEGYRINREASVKYNKSFLPPFALKAQAINGFVYYGSFASVAERFGVIDILREWMFAPEDAHTAEIKLLTLSRYFSVIVLVGVSTLASLSAMRKGEVTDLHVDCFLTFRDSEFGTAHYLCGPTTKTIDDSDARWVTCEDSERIVKAISVISHLRMKCAVESGVPYTPEEVEFPFLVLRAYEPWGGANRHYPTAIRSDIYVDKLQFMCPGFFADGQMKITEKDLDIAIAATPTLDLDKFVVGELWPFAFHQFRRTLLLNARKSESVSLGSLQYQAKHLFQDMGRHYDRNFSRLAVSAEMKEEYISTAYEIMAMKAESLASPAYISLLNPFHKSKLISFIEGKDLKQLIQMAKKGLYMVKETLMGICLRQSYCPYGSADFILGCNGCVHGLVSKEKLPVIQQANDWIEDQLSESPTGAKKEAFEAQHKFTQELIALINVE